LLCEGGSVLAPRRCRKITPAQTACSALVQATTSVDSPGFKSTSIIDAPRRRCPFPRPPASSRPPALVGGGGIFVWARTTLTRRGGSRPPPSSCSMITSHRIHRAGETLAPLRPPTHSLPPRASKASTRPAPSPRPANLVSQSAGLRTWGGRQALLMPRPLRPDHAAAFCPRPGAWRAPPVSDCPRSR